MRRPAAVASAMGALYEPFSYVAFFFRRPDDGVFRIVHPSLPAGRVGTRRRPAPLVRLRRIHTLIIHSLWGTPKRSVFLSRKRRSVRLCRIQLLFGPV